MEGLTLKFKPHKTCKKPLLYKKGKFEQICAGRKFIYLQNASVTAHLKHGLMLVRIV